jgi:hypothetical protein
MQIILQNGFLTFVRKYCGYDLGTTEIFNIIQDYFFSSKEIDLDFIKDKTDVNTFMTESIIKDKSEKKAFITEGIYLKNKDKDRLSVGLLDTHEKIILIQDIMKKERVIVCVKLFRQMLIEKDIPLYLSYHSINTINKEVSSTDLFLVESSFYELLNNNFEVMHGAYVKYIEDDLNDAINIFCKEFKKDNPVYQKFRKDEDVDLFFKLYVENQCIQIFSMFENSQDWSTKTEDDSSVSLYLQRTYHMPQTKINKYILPSLAKVRGYVKGL